ncbi:hypothetical protein GCM10027299_51910 [Larkinella ripae]
MKKPYWMLVFLLTLSASIKAQQPTSPTEETQRRLRRTETRTTTPTLYAERDSILALLKNRMAVLNPGAGTGGSLTGWFTEEARITDNDGSSKTPAEFQASHANQTYRNYRVRKLEINENTAQAVEVYSYVPASTPGTATASPQTATATSQLRKDPDGRWRITEMRVSSK